jgi:hypothetical protein
VGEAARFSSRASAAKEGNGAVLMYCDGARRRQRAAIGEKRATSQ